MKPFKPRLASIALATAALALGWLLAGGRGPVNAGGGSRSGQSASVAGPVKVESGGAVQFGMGKIQAPLDAVYWIDYRGARLYASIPSSRKTAKDVQLLREFAERDLVDDFALKPGDQPSFLMQAASLGGMGGGSSLLIVIEATSKQIAAYQAMPRANTLDGRPQFERLQLASYGPATSTAPAPGPRGEPIGVTGPIVIQQAPDGTQVPLDAVYWIDSDRDLTLHAVIPSMQRTAGESLVLTEVGGRDLAADFGVKPGSAPRFLLNPMSLGAAVQGSAALMVIETTTKQVAAYQASPRSAAGGVARAELELIQIKSYVKGPGHGLPVGN
ncbi:MAG TPA: hypothetical protein VGH33_21510 [Isosphaeraceae bacterium]